MLQNKIYQNFLLEILKTFIIIIFGLTLIAFSIRSVNFLDLIVESGYPLKTYFFYSILNLFGIAPKFIPFAFLISIIIFILKHINDKEFDVLWVSGVKKIKVVNLFLIASSLIVIVYLILTTLITPYALNKSRQLLNKDNLNSFLPTISSSQFSDSFKGFTYIVEKKINDEVENIFLNDKGNNLKNLSSKPEDADDVTIIAKKGFVKKREIFLIDGQIISSKKEFTDNEVFKFKQLKVDLGNLSTATVKQPKLQETSSLKLLSCFSSNIISKICKEDAKKEIIPILVRRAITPFYIPVLALICSFLLLRNLKNFTKKIFIFLITVTFLILTELFIRYTGLNYILRLTYIIMPFLLMVLIYPYLLYKFDNEVK